VASIQANTFARMHVMTKTEVMCLKYYPNSTYDMVIDSRTMVGKDCITSMQKILEEDKITPKVKINVTF